MPDGKVFAHVSMSQAEGIYSMGFHIFNTGGFEIYGTLDELEGYAEDFLHQIDQQREIEREYKEQRERE